MMLDGCDLLAGLKYIFTNNISSFWILWLRAKVSGTKKKRGGHLQPVRDMTGSKNNILENKHEDGKKLRESAEISVCWGQDFSRLLPGYSRLFPGYCRLWRWGLNPSRMQSPRFKTSEGFTCTYSHTSAEKTMSDIQLLLHFSWL